ncbi:hypothetical protein OIU77_030908 [Salix suchowensis]|uniref:Uncharacterized protein n=1 Tax=Salix suchowensis TaxID=1278906 RepID=A0ABQ9BH50_9ROSI|nr:hypothetical protein OIU77_030908 [Salix suchowensis]
MNTTCPDFQCRARLGPAEQLLVFAHSKRGSWALAHFPRVLNSLPLARSEFNRLGAPLEPALTVSSVSAHDPELGPNHDSLALVSLLTHLRQLGPLVLNHIIHPCCFQRVLVLVMASSDYDPAVQLTYGEEGATFRHVLAAPPLTSGELVDKNLTQRLVVHRVPSSQEDKLALRACDLAEQRKSFCVHRNRFDPVPRPANRVEYRNSIFGGSSRFGLARNRSGPG